MNTEYGGFQFNTISTFKIQNIEMALKSTPLIEHIEMLYIVNTQVTRKKFKLGRI